jgi:3-dehydroquinate synthase
MGGIRKINNIALTGFSATGKSSVATKVATFLGWQVVDIDKEVVRLARKEIEAIFQQEGEDGFRRIEHEVLEQACMDRCTVIATGGGIIIDPRNRELLHGNCLVIALEAKMETIYHRLFESNYQSGSPVVRPLLSGKNLRESIKELKSARQLQYMEIADSTIHTDDLTTDEICMRVIALWNSLNRTGETISEKRQGGAACIVDTSEGLYPVFVGTDILDGLGEKLRGFGFKGKATIISDSNVYVLYGERCTAAIEKAGFKVFHHVVPAGEISKSHNEAIKIYDFLIREHIERNDVIVALGGGMVGDLAGFIAATYMRGIPWIQVPTTLIGMVDASIGGKVAINHPKGKNLIGSFYQPRMVVADVKTLFTLPERELNSGWAEVIKHGLILDKEYFEIIESSSSEMKKLDLDITPKVIARSDCIKAQVVSEDEKEKGKRIILNYGHTVAHGLEAATDYTLFLHGEAVSIGMMVAAKISSKSGLLDPEVVRRQQDVLRKFNLPVECTGISLEPILQSMKIDKKVRDEALQWVLLEDIGKTRVIDTVDDSIVIESLHEVIKS